MKSGLFLFVMLKVVHAANDLSFDFDLNFDRNRQI